MNNLLKKVLLCACVFLAAPQITAQSAQELAGAARAQNITTTSQVQSELAKRGISESQARQMARIRGIDYDVFLATYFTDSTPSTPPASGGTDTPVVAEMVTTALPLGAMATVEQTPTPSPNPVPSRFFGYEIFDNNPFAEKEYLVGNIDQGYIIAPGDELRIIVFGSSSYETQVTVDLNGNITLPQIGVLMVSGSNFASLKDRLTTYIGKYIESLLSTPQSSFIDISLTQIRPIKITVLGESNTPGPHLISGFASVLNALYSSGGIKSSGSLREIHVYRDNKLLKTLDLYDYITTGNLDDDIRLTNNDIVFIPQRLSSVELQGRVKKEGVYELKQTEGIEQLIQYSGGLPATASLENVNITRIIPFENRSQKQIYDRFLTSINLQEYRKQNKPFSLIDGDQVSFNAILDRVVNQVTIQGNVYQPGTYSVEQFADLKSLIDLAAKQIKPNTYLNKVDIFKENDQGELVFKTYNLSEVLKGTQTVLLEDQDQVRVYSEQEVKGEDRVSVAGFVTDPIDVFWRENLSLYDLIFQATDFEKETYLAQLLDTRLDVFRFNPSSGLYQINTYQLLDRQRLKSIYVQPRDIVKLYSQGINIELNPQVVVGGYTQGSASIQMKEKMTVEDAILQVGGFTQYADRELAVVNREKFDVNLGQVTERFEVPIDLDYILGLKQQPSSPFYLQKNDVVAVRKQAGVTDKVTVAVSGEVVYPGNLTLEYELNTFEDIIEKAGGLKNTANLDASFISRAGEIIYLDLKRTKNRDFIQDGDLIVIRDNNGLVRVEGAINNESSLIYEPGKRAKYYIRNSGGLIRSEVEDKFVVLPNGRSEQIKFLNNPKVLPESRIVLTRKVPKADNNNNTDTNKFMDQFIRIFSVVTGALTTAILAQRL